MGKGEGEGGRKGDVVRRSLERAVVPRRRVLAREGKHDALVVAKGTWFQQAGQLKAAEPAGPGSRISGLMLPAVHLDGSALESIAQGFTSDESGWAVSLRGEWKLGCRPLFTDVCSGLDVEAASWGIKANIATQQGRRPATLGWPGSSSGSREVLQIVFAEISICII